MPTRPLIGVLCRTNSVFAEDRTVVDRYVAAVDQTGLGDIVLLPTDCTRGSLECLLAPLDGLVLTGSPNNVDAYRHDAEVSAGPFDAARDAAALELVRAAAKIDKPILGICRGLEQINVALGGSLKERFSDAGRAVVRHAPTSTIGLDMFNWNHDHFRRGRLAASCRKIAHRVGKFGSFQGNRSAGRQAPRRGTGFFQWANRSCVRPAWTNPGGAMESG